MKKRYLCPVCEHELTAGSYCPECHRFRREPLVYTGGLLPNERAEGQDTVKTDGKTAAPPSGSGRTETAGTVRTVPGKDFYEVYRDPCGNDKPHRYGVPNVDPHRTGRKKAKKKEKKRGVKAVMVIWFLFLAVLILYEPVKSLLEEAGAEQETEDAFWDPEEETFQLQLLSDEQVIEEGVPCNAYTHYAADGEEYVLLLEEYLGELLPGAVIQSSDMGSYNSIEGDRTSYETRCSIDIEADGEYPYIIVLWDTATGEVMEVSLYAESGELFERMVLAAACGLSPDKDRQELWEQIQSLFAETPSGDYQFVQLEESELFLYLEEGYNSVSFTCLEQYDKYGG